MYGGTSYIKSRCCGRSRFGCFALIFSSILSLTAFKLSLHLLALVGDDVSLHHPISAVESVLVHACSYMVLMMNESKGNPHRIDEKSKDMAPLSTGNMAMMNESKGKLSSEALCRDMKAEFDYCEIEGDVRVDPNSLTIFVVGPRSSISATNETSSWIIEPYPRKGTGWVKKWTVKIAAADDSSVPKCGEIHSLPALLFSIGGFTGNHYHDFADVLVPLFITASRFNKEVQFLATDYREKWWWPRKYRPLLNSLSRHVIVDIDDQKIPHCYKHLIAGLQNHGSITVDPSVGLSINQFRRLLRRTYSLNRDMAIRYRGGGGNAPRPRLMIASRSRTRVLTNEDQICGIARKLGFEVEAAEGQPSGNLTKFAQLVNSCDVIMGVHGAGLTNMVFLPEKAVLIQILPLGAINRFASYRGIASGMDLRYLEYEIGVNESSLIQRYPIIRDPMSVHREGWSKIFEVYLENQNITIDVRRFGATLTKALDLLRS